MNTQLRRQRGVSTIVVLILLAVMLLGGLALSRMTEVSTLVAGNVAYKTAAMQASEVGLAQAFTAARALADEEANSGSWYWSLSQAKTSDGLPSTANWTAAPSITVGAYNVRYVVERVCEGALPVTDSFRQCLVKEIKKEYSAAVPMSERPENPYSTQYRITVRVTGPKDTTVFVQSLVTRGST